MYFEKASSQVRYNRESFIEGNPLFKSLFSGNFTKWQYLAYLKETYHLIKHTPKMLNLAAQKVGDSDAWLRDFFLEFEHEERGHDQLCVNDIKAMNEDPERILSIMPSGGSWAMVSQNYYNATIGDPTAIIGYAVATEGLGAEFAREVADLLESQYLFPSHATTFLRVHGHEDIEHVELAKSAIEKYGSSPESYRNIVHVWNLTLQYYGQLFQDSISLGNKWESDQTTTLVA